MILNDDYRDMLLALNAARVKFILVGAYALAAHGYPRATMDIDVWVMPAVENATAIMQALRTFGAPLHSISETDFHAEDLIFQIGVAPRRIDLITSISGVNFADAFTNAIEVEIDGIKIRALSLPDLIINKRASGRTKDLADVEMLERKQTRK